MVVKAVAKASGGTGTYEAIILATTIFGALEWGVDGMAYGAMLGFFAMVLMKMRGKR